MGVLLFRFLITGIVRRRYRQDPAGLYRKWGEQLDGLTVTDEKRLFCLYRDAR